MNSPAGTEGNSEIISQPKPEARMNFGGLQLTQGVWLEPSNLFSLLGLN
jgi:hypothetical protein